MKVGDSTWMERVRTGCASSGVPVSEAALERLAAHARHLILWNRKINLTAITDPEAVADLHIIDSVLASPHVARDARILDMGCGGGFPGIALAVMAKERDVVMVDAVRKKVSFVSDVIRTLKLENARAVHGRVEALPEDLVGSGFTCITSRAFTALERFVALSLPLLADGGEILALKGADVKRELDLFRKETCTLKSGEAVPASDFHVEILSCPLPHGGEKRYLVRIRPPAP